MALDSRKTTRASIGSVPLNDVGVVSMSDIGVSPYSFGRLSFSLFSIRRFSEKVSFRHGESGELFVD